MLVLLSFHRSTDISQVRPRSARSCWTQVITRALSRLSMSSAVKLMNLAGDVICREPNGITLFRFSLLLLHIHNSGRDECTHDAFPMRIIEASESAWPSRIIGLVRD